MTNSTNGEGGYQPPNYTQIPNAFLDLQMPKIKSLAELKVVLAVMRQTFGWHKDEDELSISRFEDLTGLSRPSVNEGIKAALQHRLIVRRKSGNTYLYSLNVKNLDSKESKPKVVKDLNQQVVKNLNPQKKGTKEKERNAPQGSDEPKPKRAKDYTTETVDLARSVDFEPTQDQRKWWGSGFALELRNGTSDKDVAALQEVIVEQADGGVYCSVKHAKEILRNESQRFVKHKANGGVKATKSTLPEHEQWKETANSKITNFTSVDQDEARRRAREILEGAS